MEKADSGMSKDWKHYECHINVAIKGPDMTLYAKVRKYGEEHGWRYSTIVGSKDLADEGLCFLTKHAHGYYYDAILKEALELGAAISKMHDRLVVTRVKVEQIMFDTKQGDSFGKALNYGEPIPPHERGEQK